MVLRGDRIVCVVPDRLRMRMLEIAPMIRRVFDTFGVPEELK